MPENLTNEDGVLKDTYTKKDPTEQGGWSITIKRISKEEDDESEDEEVDPKGFGKLKNEQKGIPKASKS